MATLTIFSVITKFLGFVFRLYLSRVLPTDVLGMYTVALSVAMVLETIVGAGLPLVISRITAVNNKDNNYTKSYKTVSAGLVWSTSLALIIITCVILGHGIFDVLFTSSTTYIILLTMLPSILSTAIYTPFRGYLWGEERYFAVSFVEFIEQILRIIATIILFRILDNNILPTGLGLSMACATSCIVGIIIYHKVGGKIKNPAGEIKSVFSATAPLMFTRFAGSLMMPLINILLPIMLIASGYSNTQAMSLIGIVMGMTIPLLYVPSAVTMSLGMALIPKLSALKKDNNTFALCNQINTSISFTIYSCIFFIPLFSGLGEQICILLYGNIEAGVYLTGFSWLILPMGLSQICTSILNALGHEKQSFIYFIISSIVMIVSILILPKYIGISALLVAIGLGNCITFILSIRKINKATSHKGTYIRKTLVMLGLCIPVAVLTRLLYNILIYIFPPIVSMLICTIICILALALLLSSLGLIDYETIKIITRRFTSKSIKQK